MGKENKLWYSQPQVWWLIVIILAGLVYFMGISHESIWFDEAYSAMMASRSPGELLGLMTFDNHPPLYYLLLSVIMSIFGNSVWALRLLSVLGAIGLVSLGAGPVRRLFGDRTAFIYAGVVLFTPVVLIYAHEARMYSLAAFCATASVLYGYLAVKYNRRWDWFAFGLASLATAYLHYYGLMAVFFMHLLIFFWLLLKKREYLRSHLVTGAAVTVGYLPWLASFFKQVSSVNKGFWISAVGWNGILNAAIQPFAYKDSYPHFVPLMAIVLVFSLVLIVIGLVIAKIKADDEWAFGLFTLLVLLCSFISPIIISLVSKPIFYERYIVVLDGLFLLLLSLGISLLPTKWLQVAAFAFFAIANAATMRNIYAQYFNLPMNRAAEYLKTQIHPGEPIVTSELMPMGPAVYYLPEAGNFNTKSSSGDALEQQLKVPFYPYLHMDQEVDDLVSSHQSFWYLTSDSEIAKDIRLILKGEQGWEASGKPVIFSGPFLKNSVTCIKYIYTGRIIAPKYGMLNLHITGLRPPGYIIITLKSVHDEDFSRSVYMSFNSAEMTLAVDVLYFGDYFIQVIHDENNNKTADLDSRTGLFSEGFGMVNMDKLDLRDAAAVRAGLTSDNLKVTFDEDGKTVEIKIYYVPFPWQK